MKPKVKLGMTGKDILVASETQIVDPDFMNLDMTETSKNGYYLYRLRAVPNNAFVLRYVLKNFSTIFTNDTIPKQLASLADKVEKPRVSLSRNAKTVEINVPYVKVYKDMMAKVGAYPLNNFRGYRVGIDRVMDLEELNKNLNSSLPRLSFHKDVLNLHREKIDGFDGTIASLKDIPISELNIVKANKQSWNNLKKSKKSVEEKLSSFGLSTLYDLLFWLPRRYIDKSNPQDISELVEGETAVIIGDIIDSSQILYGRGGARFTVLLGGGKTIDVTFFNQKWLLQKFKVGTEVLITGKLTWYNRKLQISGTSIEHSEEAAILPIVPVYKQSPTRGITTNMLLSANRELLSRMGKVSLPKYFDDNDSNSYGEALSQLHFPTSIREQSDAVEELAFNELVMMQLLIRDAKEKTGSHPGVSATQGEKKLQEKGIEAFPYELTVSQREAVETMNKRMSEEVPASVLLNAETGSGKTLVGQLASLRAVDAGYQVVQVAPTDILARQLYNSFMKLNEQMFQKTGEKVNIAFLGGATKAAEKKSILARVASGGIQVLIGTHAVLSSKVKYKNLGLIVVDEQQKFGAMQRSALLSARDDGRVPDLLMQTATPIPRSTAQMFYGDVDMIELRDKPPGRKDIVTEWIVEDPNEIIMQPSHRIWNDIKNEAGKGNQTFIVTPLVTESDKIDAASVERTYDYLKDLALPGLRIAYAHGKMKQDEQQTVMEDFRLGKYDVLVASTVVEVGVDIPAATRMVILSADRLGSSSLWQTRGRVGRNELESICYLVSPGKTENSQKRLRSIVEARNGFEVAQADLELRGEGKLFSTEQSGENEMKFASLLRHSGKIDAARAEADRILSSEWREEAIRDAREQFNNPEKIV